MAQIVLNKAPDKLSKLWDNIDFEVFLLNLTEYLEDSEDISLVKDEMSKKEEVFDYDLVRKDYV